MPLSAAEQYFLELQNRARLDPAAEAARYGIDLNQGLAPGTLNGSSRPVLAANDLLNAAANDHSGWMLAQDVFSHTGVNGSSPGDRIEDAGYSFSGNWTWGENIAWSGSTGSLNLDTAVSGHHAGLFRSVGHRTNILNGSFQETGIGQLSGQFLSNSTNWNASMLTTVFARSGSSVFVTGVAYSDTNADQFYSIGEGRGGVTFQIGTPSAGTSTAGGYALATSAAAATVVSILHGGFTSQLRIDTTGGNAKLDLVGDRTVLASASVTLVSGEVTDVRLLGLNNLTATGNASANSLVGNAGANLLYGGGAGDTVNGGLGNDHLWGGTGADSHIGGGGVDYARYDDANHGNLVISLATPASNTGAATGDTYSDIEGLVGGAGNDVIFGDSAANWLFGSGGGDMVYGGAGNDLVFGDAGSDNLWGGTGADAHYGGTDAGIDFARYDEAYHGNLVISLSSPSTNTGAAAGDTYSAIEGLVGGAGGDVVIGNAAANWLFGQGGGDYIDGLGGSDYLAGGASADRFRFSTAPGAGNVDTIADFAHGSDDILLVQSVFAAIGTNLTADEFAIGAAADANDFIVYSSVTGALSYDADGNGTGASVQFATLSPGLTLTIDDFMLV